MHIFKFGKLWNSFLKQLYWFQHHRKVLIVPHPRQHLILSVFLIVAILGDMAYGFNFPFPGTSDSWAQHLLCAYWLWINSSVKSRPTYIFCPFFCWIAWSFLYFLKMSLLQISFLFCDFPLIMVSFNSTCS